LRERGDAADLPNEHPMLVALLIVSVWLFVALAAVALCAYARHSDEEIERAELAPVFEISSAA
jgi:hypothetical protein